jgi:hypothetical protein
MLDTNDMRFATVRGFNSGEHFFRRSRDNLNVLLVEDIPGAPNMLSVGLHCPLAVRPGRSAVLARFLDDVPAHSNVWSTRIIDVARHWHRHHLLK